MLIRNYFLCISKQIYIFPIYWLITGFLFYPNSKSTLIDITILTIVLSIIAARTHFKKIFDQTQKIIIFRTTLACLIYLVILNLCINVGANYIRIYFFIMLYFIFIPDNTLQYIKDKLNIFMFIASLSTLGFVLYNYYILDLNRMWIINPIPYSTIIAVIAIINLFYSIISNTLFEKTLSSIGFLITLPGLILSETRGVWLALIIIIPIILLYASYILKRKKEVITLILLSIIITAPFISYITPRLSQTTYEFNKIKNNENSSSIGLRLEIWKAASIIIPENLFFGIGDGVKEKEIRKNISKEYNLNNFINHLSHYHNEILNLLVTYGLVGLIAFFLPFLTPIYLFIINSKQKCFISAIICLLYLIAGMTDVPLRNPHSLLFYYFIIFIYLTPSDNKKFVQ